MARPAPPRDVELCWPGKRGRAAPLPAGARVELVERVSGRGRPPPGAAPPQRPNRLLLGDNLAALAALRSELRGQIDLVTVDLPFATGNDYRVPLRLGEAAGASAPRELVAYRDAWGPGLAGYLTMLEPRLRLLHALLSERGSAYVHVDQRASAVVRLLLEEIFGRDAFINELVWAYRTGGTPARLGFSRKHDTILFFAKDPAQALWNPALEKSRLGHRYGFKNVEILVDEDGPYRWAKCRDVLDVPALRGNQPERVDYPTQKPEALIERLVRASTEPGSLVLDCFAGSGTALVVAERLGRRWLGCDASPLAVAVARKRLLALVDRAPFEIAVARTDPDETAPGPVPCPRVRAVVDGRRVHVELTGLAYDRDGALPAGIRLERERCTELVDSWAVGWDCPDGIATADWVACRSRAERSLPLASASHRYPRRGRYPIVVSLLDVFGGRGTVALTVEVDE